AGLDPRRGFGDFLRNFPQKLRCALLRFRRNVVLYERLHALQFFVDTFSKFLKIIDFLQARNLLVDPAAELLEFVHDSARGSSCRVKLFEFCIIGTRCVARKEENWRFRMCGSGAWSAGRACCGEFLEVMEASSSAVRRFAQHAVHWSASTPRGATCAARTC